MVLEYEGYECLEAGAGQAGIEMLRREDPDAVLLDIKMPGMDGLEVLQSVRAKDAHTPVLMISGHGDIPTAVEAIQKGAYDFLEGLLEEVVGALLDRLDRGGDVAVPRDHQHGRVRVLGAHGLQDLQPVHARHLDVEEDRVGVLAAQHLDPGLPGPGLEALVSLVLEDHAQRFPDRLLVVDEQDLLFHASPMILGKSGTRSPG